MNLTEQWKKYLEELTDPENIDVSSIKESLMSRPQAPNMAEESLMARR